MNFLFSTKTNTTNTEIKSNENTTNEIVTDDSIENERSDSDFELIDNDKLSECVARTKEIAEKITESFKEVSTQTNSMEDNECREMVKSYYDFLLAVKSGEVSLVEYILEDKTFMTRAIELSQIYNKPKVTEFLDNYLESKNQVKLNKMNEKYLNLLNKSKKSDKLESELEYFKDRVEGLKETIKKNNADNFNKVAELNDKIKQSNDRWNLLMENHQKLLNINIDLTKNLDSCRREISTYQTNGMNTFAANENLVKEVKSLKEKNIENEFDLQGYKELRDQYRKLNEKLNKVEEEYASNRKYTYELEDDLDCKEATVDELSEELDDLKKQYKSLEKKLKVTDISLYNSNNDCDELEEENMLLEKDNTTLKVLNKDLQEKVKNLEYELENTAEELEDSNMKLHEDTVISLKDKIEDLQGEKDHFENRYQEFKDLYDEIYEDYSKYFDKYFDLKKENNELYDDYSYYYDNYYKVKEDYKELHKKFDEYYDKYAKASEELNMKNLNLKERDLELENLYKKYTELNSDKKVLEEKYEILEHDFNELETETPDAFKPIRSDTLAELNTRLAESRNKNVNLFDRLEGLIKKKKN